MSRKPDTTERVHKQIRAMSAYRVAPQSVRIKLDAMESPYGFDTDELSAWHVEALGDVSVNRYPDPSAQALKRRIRQVFEIPDCYELTLGNGSDELLQIIQLAVGGERRCIMAPQPSFVMYEMIARYTRAKFISVDLDENFELKADSWLSQVERHQPDCVFFAYPNNPTGNLFDPQIIEQTARISPGLVAVDEAYHEYSGKSMMHAMANHENLVIVRTLSKSGLAGLRIGYLISHPQWASEFEKLRMPYNVGVLNQQAAQYALDRWDEFNRGDQIIAERQRLFEILNHLAGVRVHDSAANFLTVRFCDMAAEKIFESLKAQGVLVKNLHGSHRVLSNCLRITVSTTEENNEMYDALVHSLSKNA